MACTDNTGSYVNIKELPEINDVVSGDFLIIETPSGTNILDFNNFIISLENTTFSDTILSNTADIITLSSQYATLSTDLQMQIDSNTANINYLLTGANIETYAVFTVDTITPTTGAVTIHSSSNIQDTVTYNPATSAFTFQFIRNFEKNTGSSGDATLMPYGVQTSTLINYNIGVQSASDITTNSVTLYIRDSTGVYAPTVTYAMFNIIGGTISLNNSTS